MPLLRLSNPAGAWDDRATSLGCAAGAAAGGRWPVEHASEYRVRQVKEIHRRIFMALSHRLACGESMPVAGEQQIFMHYPLGETSTASTTTLRFFGSVILLTVLALSMAKE